MKKRIFITGDTHGSYDIGKFHHKLFPQQNTLTKDDYVVICGDAGLVWNNSHEEIKLREWLNNKPFTTLFIDGNHDNHNLLQQYPVEMWNGGKIHRISDSIFHLMRGQVFTIHGKTFFTMGGAASVDRHRRTEGKDWWAEEIPSYQEMDEGVANLETTGWKVDYLITHTIFDEVVSQNMKLMRQYDNTLNSYFKFIHENVEFDRWFYGHFHQDISLGKFQMTYWKFYEI